MENKQLSTKEFKKLMSLHFTVRHKVVKTCGHKLDTKGDPRTGCPDCWWAYFLTNKDMTDIAAECLGQPNGAELLIKIRGKRFARQFGRFVVQLAEMQRAESAKESKDGQEASDIERISAGQSDSGAVEGDSEPDQNGELGHSGISQVGEPNTGGSADHYITEPEGPVGGTEEGGAGA